MISDGRPFISSEGRVVDSQEPEDAESVAIAAGPRRGDFEVLESIQDAQSVATSLGATIGWLRSLALECGGDPDLCQGLAEVEEMSEQLLESTTAALVGGRARALGLKRPTPASLVQSESAPVMVLADEVGLRRLAEDLVDGALAAPRRKPPWWLRSLPPEDSDHSR